MKIKLIFFTPLLLFFILSCKNSFERVSYHENGKVNEQFSISKDSVRNGVYKKYLDNGNLFEQSNYVDGELHGERTLYYTNGNPEIIETYEKGNIAGSYKVFRENGELLLEYSYENGQIEGISRKYFKGGALEEEVTFENGAENGPFKEYYESGGVQWEGQFLNGPNEFGTLMQYDEQGELIKKMQCDSLGICQTIWTLEEGNITPKEIKIGND